MIPPSEALQRVLASVSALTEASCEAAQPDSGFGVIVAPVLADRDIPEQNLSRMDGFAVAAPLAAGAVLQVNSTTPAGSPAQHAPLEDRHCHRIFTGAVLPPGANAVVEQEATARGGSQVAVEIRRDVQVGDHVVARGSVARKGEVVLPARAPAGAAQVALCAAVGSMPLRCPVPRVAILCTGDEVVQDGTTPQPHQTRDVNGPSITAAVRSLDIRVASASKTSDDLDALTGAMNALESDAHVDAVITVGGVSVGDYDLVPRAIESSGGRILLHRVAVKPGKPFLFAVSRTNKPVFGLPGNPLSALVTFFEFVAPALRKMAGRPEPWAPTLPVRLTTDVHGDRQRMHFVLARVSMHDDGQWFAEPIVARHSADIVAGGKADGVILVPQGRERLEAGQQVRFRPWRPLW
jgi:molybdopterin molybdotransferase